MLSTSPVEVFLASCTGAWWCWGLDALRLCIVGLPALPVPFPVWMKTLVSTGSEETSKTLAGLCVQAVLFPGWTAEKNALPPTLPLPYDESRIHLRVAHLVYHPVSACFSFAICCPSSLPTTPATNSPRCQPVQREGGPVRLVGA